MSDIRGTSDDTTADLSRWMVRASPDGLWVFDEHGRTLFANDRMAAMLGREPGEMPGFPVFDAVDDLGKAQFRAHLAELATKGVPGDNIECSLLDKNGERFWALVSHTPLIDDDGVQRGWMHRVSEHSAQRRLLDQLAEAQSIAKIGSWEWDVRADVVWWSDELYRIYGMDSADLSPTYEGFLARIHPDDRDAVATAVGEALEATDSFEFDARVVRRTGEVTWIRGRGLVTRDPEGRPVRMGGTTQDITAKKDAEQALGLLTAMATAANSAATLAEALPAVMVEVGRHTTWKPLMAAVVDSEAVMAPPIRPDDGDGATGEVPVFAFELAERAVSGQDVVIDRSGEGTVTVGVPIMAEGRVACVVVLDTRTTAMPAASDAATIGQIRALFSRVAEREWTAEHLARARDEAMEASHAKSAFLATMSHEIRTPLNGVIGLSELLRRTDLTPQQRRMSEGIDQAGRVLLELVNDILDLSKIEAGRLDLETVDFDPSAVLERSAGLMSERARAKSLDLSVAHGPDVPAMVAGDPVRFGQVVTNLTSNAVKFTDSGRVLVRMSLDADADAGPVLRVEVSDTGVGITPAVRSRLFESFSQGDSSTTRQYGGTGLGLAISRQIVRAMGGEIGVVSEPGRGSTFWFTIAFATAASRLVEGSVAQAAAVSGLRVLVIGDDEARRQLMEEQLTAWSVAVSPAASGIEGVVLLDDANRRGSPFDAIVVDDLGPGLGGEQVARMVRSDSRFARTRILLVTSPRHQQADPDVLAEAGVDATLTSPVMPSSLFDAMVTVAGGHLVPARRSSTPIGPESGHGVVLVVEDNAVNQLVAEGVLESLGYAVLLADNGIEGVAMHERAADDLVAVLMDCQMPQMDGYEATRRIREAEGSDRHIPIIAMTASAIAGERERCLQSGMDDFLTKPIDVALLRSTLQRWTGGRSVERVEDLVAEVVPAGGAPVADAVLDRARLDELCDLAPGDPTMVLRFIDRFGSGAREKLVDLRGAHAAGDAHTQGRVAHGLKGSAANLGAAALADLCREIEDLGDEGRLAEPTLVEQLEVELDRATAALEEFAAQLRAG